MLRPRGQAHEKAGNSTGKSTIANALRTVVLRSSGQLRQFVCPGFSKRTMMVRLVVQKSGHGTQKCGCSAIGVRSTSGEAPTGWESKPLAEAGRDSC